MRCEGKQGVTHLKLSTHQGRIFDLFSSFYSYYLLQLFRKMFILYWSIANLGFPGSSAGRESACNEGDPSSIPGLGRSPGGEHGNPL